MKKLFDIDTISNETTYTLENDSFANYDELHFVVKDSAGSCDVPVIENEKRRIIWFHSIGGSPIVLNIGCFEITIIGNTIKMKPMLFSQRTSGDMSGCFNNGVSYVFNNISVYGKNMKK